MKKSKRFAVCTEVYKSEEGFVTDIRLDRLTKEEAEQEVRRRNRAKPGTDLWAAGGWFVAEIISLPTEPEQKIPSSRRLTTGICIRTGRVIPFGTKCRCGCGRMNRRIKYINGKITDILKR